MDKSRLLKEIARHPAIWDTRINFSSRRVQMHLGWLDVAKVMQCSVDECRRKWNGLRGNYRAELRRLGRRRWRHFREMEFMRDVFFTPPSSTTQVRQMKPVPNSDCGLAFDVEEKLFHVVDRLEPGFDLDEEMGRQWCSDHWMWDLGLELFLSMDATLFPSPPTTPHHLPTWKTSTSDKDTFISKS
ncbi:uncharacterized protein LOC108049841 [Drosophila rhopaloa]|uniref:Uncharacterized protein LOC108049841 n=1 Tax=Drosophila rhopaloa TaxID=1041015 RepID=A0A6P4FC12_DRORH|nr:uncharacterized protein LOC108049841 [Drosophila rhopaloa]